MPDTTPLHPPHRLRGSRPSRILSKQKLLEAWNSSRDSKSRPGAPGSDGVRAKSFASNLDENLTRLAYKVAKGLYGFSKLRARPIERPGKTDRIICIPTVEDRLVQRALSEHVYNRRLLPIFNSSSFGFIPNTGTRDAIKRCLELRARFDYAFETDISSFFDTIDRKILLERLDRRLRRSSVLPLLKGAVTLEIGKSDAEVEKKKLR